MHASQVFFPHFAQYKIQHPTNNHAVLYFHTSFYSKFVAYMNMQI